MSILELRDVSKRYGGVAALDGLDLQICDGEIRGIIGPNGAGKTTLFNVVTGTQRPTSGEILYNGENIAGLHPSSLARKGLVRSFQRPAVFGSFTVLENLEIAEYVRYGETPLEGIFGLGKSKELRSEKRALEILDFMDLTPFKDEAAANLAHGHQKSVGIAAALAVQPKVLMMDEPVAGMNPTETRHTTEIIRRVRDELGITVLLVEHDMRTVMKLCDNITVLNFGQKLAEGLPKEIRENNEVIEAYLGVEDDVA